ncbi:hypothetical protein KY284_030103 [Solanum tuberosum]|nr:hypothetical protein KY284_030103 [Solanum tuberosum]
MERINALLECYLRHYVSANQKDWTKLLDTAQFSYNLQRSEATGRSPFELATRQQPNTPQSLPVDAGLKSPSAYHMAKAWEEQVDLARSYLDKAARKMKKFADRKRRLVDYRIGDQVMIKLNLRQFKSLRSVSESLIRRYEGPFEIIAKAGKISFRTWKTGIGGRPVKLKYSLLHQPWTNRSRQLLIINWFTAKAGTIRARSSLSIGKERLRRRPRGRSTRTYGSSATKSTLICSFKGEADSCCASAGLKQRVEYFPAFGDDLENLDRHMAALTFSQNGPQQRGQG